jgi:hypothetical protein
VKKSSARIPCAWDRRNSAQPGPSRRGAGSIPAFLRICQTVDTVPGVTMSRVPARRSMGSAPASIASHARSGPRQTRVHPRLLPLRNGELMPQDQDLGVLPPRLPA